MSSYNEEGTSSSQILRAAHSLEGPIRAPTPTDLQPHNPMFGL